jgi:putative flippase GtrA
MPAFKKLLRMAASSTAASAVDLVTLFTVLQLLPLWPGAAGAVGCVAGGAVNFALCRGWVFQKRGEGWLGQLWRYAILVVLAGALLAGAVIQLATAVVGLPVLLAKGISAALVLACWNYPISARLVFKGAHAGLGGEARLSPRAAKP